MNERQKQAKLEDEKKKSESTQTEDVRGNGICYSSHIIMQMNLMGTNYFATELTDEERKAIVSSHDFLEFVDTSSKIVERALHETYDFMKDYTIGAEVTR